MMLHVLAFRALAAVRRALADVQRLSYARYP